MSRNVFNNIARGAGYAKTRRLLWSSAAAIGALAASPAWAATCLPTVAPPVATIAVVSDFLGAAKDLITEFRKPGQPGYGKVIRICHDSTGALNTEIRSGNANHYSLFLAGNLTTPIGLQGTAFVQSGAVAQLYAQGIPALFARQSVVSNVSTLVPSQSGVSATISYNNLTNDALDTTNAATVAVADPALAPYGDAAFKIMSSTPRGMGLFAYPATPLPSPGYLSTPYSNIDSTFQSVAASPYTNKSGFVSKAQICGGIAPIKSGTPDYVYVEFTGSRYVQRQAGIRIDSGNSTQNGIGADIINYMLNNSDITFWPNFLTNHCYGQI
jgi:hypothetical protein